VQTVLREDLVRTLAAFVPPLEERFTDILDYHSTVQQAGQTAARNGVKKLMLTHYVPTMQPGSEDEWRALASGTLQWRNYFGARPYFARGVVLSGVRIVSQTPHSATAKPSIASTPKRSL